MKLYIPPQAGDDVHTYRYHLAQSVGILGLWALVWVAGFWVIGRLPFVPQIAWADDVHGQIVTVTAKVDGLATDADVIRRKLTEIQLLQLRASLSQQLKDSCLAKRAGNQADMDNANTQIGQLTDLYYQLSGRPFSLPSCDTVLADLH